MNWRKFVLLGCVAACVFVASTAKAQRGGHSDSVSRIGTHGAFAPRSVAPMPMHRGMRRMPIHRAHLKKIIFIRDFGFPWGWDPWWNWNLGYSPYGPYGYSNYSYQPFYPGYGYVYGNYSYGSSGYGYQYSYPYGSYYAPYYSGTYYENDDESAVRNVLAEYAVAWNHHDTAAFGRLFTENCDYVNVTGVHWKGVQEIVQRQAALFQNRLKTAVRTLTGVDVSFQTADVALVHATWDVTGQSRRTGEAVPVVKETTKMTIVKTNGTWLITAFQNTESRDSPR